MNYNLNFLKNLALVKCRHNSKIPAMKWKQGGIRNADYLSWLKAGYNYGILMQENGLLAIDIDISKGKTGFLDFAELEEKYGKISNIYTLKQRSASGGLHIIFRNTNLSENTA